MSETLIERHEPGYQLCRFLGPVEVGTCCQITGDNGYVQLTPEGAKTLITDLTQTFLKSEEETGWAKAGRLTARVEELQGIVGRLEGERNEARRLMDKELERMRKELEAERGERLRLERNLSRAQGYIDRVTEGEPPLPGVRTELHERIGDIGVSRVSGPDRRGPQLELGEPYRRSY